MNTTSGHKRYSPQTVVRYRLDEGHSWEEVARYDDATVREQGKNNFLGCREAMLRAYSPDPDFFGDASYQEDNGIRFITPGRRGAGYYPHLAGMVADCDGDLALKRLMMNVVISSHDHGHGRVEYVGFVSRESDESPARLANPDEYTGFGDLNEVRVERWIVTLHPDFDLPEDDA